MSLRAYDQLRYITHNLIYPSSERKTHAAVDLLLRVG